MGSEICPAVVGVESPDAAESAKGSYKLAGRLCGREEQNLPASKPESTASKQARFFRQTGRPVYFFVFIKLW
jgi:hypothetical protein